MIDKLPFVLYQLENPIAFLHSLPYPLYYQNFALLYPTNRIPRLKKYLKKEFEPPNYDNMQLLAVDEIAIKKGHSYITLVLDLQTGRVVWVGKDNTKAKSQTGH